MKTLVVFMFIALMSLQSFSQKNGWKLMHSGYNMVTFACNAGDTSYVASFEKGQVSINCVIFKECNNQNLRSPLSVSVDYKSKLVDLYIDKADAVISRLVSCVVSEKHTTTADTIAVRSSVYTFKQAFLGIFENSDPALASILDYVGSIK